MPSLEAEVREYVSASSQINTTQSLAKAFEALIRKFDGKYFIVSGIPEIISELPELIVMHNLPVDWVSEYLENDYFADDPIARQCIVSQEPFFWREAGASGTAGQSEAIMMRAEQHGLTNGVCFPIHNINGFEAGVSLSGFPSTPRPTDVRSLYLASIMTFNALRKIRSDHSLRFGPISDREREVLTWSALGKTSKEIAAILFVSESTVNAHIKNSLQKLSARNKTEAVMIGVRMGLISV